MARILRGDYAAGEDVVQEAFYRAIKFFPAYDEEKGKLSSWFNTILFNSLRDYQRASSGISDVEVDKLSVYDVFSQDTLANNPDLRTLISDSIGKVSKERHRQILFLFFILGYTSMEISQIEEKVSQTNVTTVVNRFRRQLKEKLK
jgi:RNA polymerase sigma factor (sigma-70 family)